MPEKKLNKSEKEKKKLNEIEEGGVFIKPLPSSPPSFLSTPPFKKKIIKKNSYSLLCNEM